ncbi:MAG: adenylosuccinate lyase [Bacillota bacterium]
MIDRYTLPRMGRIWETENKLRKWLEIEILACEAWSHIGKIPKEAVANIKHRARFDMQRMQQLEAVVRHDVLAFVTTVAESVGEDGKYIHFGLTSYDVVDTALSCLLVEAADCILSDLNKLAEAIAEKAIKYKYTVMPGRTHGVHAEPITFGFKMALWYAETLRNIERMKRAREEVAVGRLSGAVGTFANIDPYIERYVCDKLGLTPAPVSTQVLQRDRHAQYVCTLAIIASTLDKFATEIRGLQKTEIREVEEPFYEGQKGSSAMPHKRNPVLCEQISGLSRVVRANAQAALENVTLWHERDISHSSVERIILPDSTILVDYMLQTFTRVVTGLHVYPENMERSLKASHGLMYSGRVLLALIEKGLSREAAYEIVQSLAMKSWQEQIDFIGLLAEDPEVKQRMSLEELQELADPRSYTVNIDYIFSRVGLQ